MTRVGIITQARTTSTRLPGKVLIEAGGRTMLDHHLDRLQRSGIDIYVATTMNDVDDPIVSIASEQQLGYHRGSEQDVLARFHECAQKFHLDVVVRVTSDCPLIDGRVVAEAVAAFRQEANPRLYLSNGLVRTFPRGFDFEIFSAELLAEANDQAQEPAQREHVTPYIYGNLPGNISLRNVAWNVDRSRYRITLDTKDDLRLIKTLIEQYGAAGLSCASIIDILDRNPALAGINSHVEQKRLDDISNPSERGG